MPRCTGDAYRDLRESLKVALKEAEIHKHVTLHTQTHLRFTNGHGWSRLAHCFGAIGPQQSGDDSPLRPPFTRAQSAGYGALGRASGREKWHLFGTETIHGLTTRPSVVDSKECRSGGTGRRAAFRAQWALCPWEFESPLRHQSLCKYPLTHDSWVAEGAFL